jgi:hypothetical protein
MTTFPIRFEQTVAPNTTWFPTVINYQGDPVIERRIAEEIASFGKQLGIMSEALLEVADASPSRKQIGRLRKIVAKVEALKRRQYESLMDKATRSFEALAAESPHKAGRLLDTLAAIARDAEERKSKEDRDGDT